MIMSTTNGARFITAHASALHASHSTLELRCFFESFRKALLKDRIRSRAFQC